MSKRPKIDEELHENVQAYANLHFNGSFTAAVNKLIEVGLSLGLHPHGALTYPEVLDGPK